ncbi:MAG: hypothetical protein ACI9G1_005023 [Pirellulaceae bacterium]|jgi:hypothetical protein
MDKETREKWLKTLRDAKIVSLEDEAETAGAVKAVAEEKLTLAARQIIAYQLKLIEDGKVDELRKFFTARVRDQFSVEDVDNARQQIGQVTPEFLVHQAKISPKGDVAKIVMQNGRTLTTLLKVKGMWAADTIWFK